MSEFQRNTVYLYLYENGKPVRSVGYLKRTKRSEDDKIQIHINGFYTTGNTEGVIYIIKEQGDHYTAHEIASIAIDNSKGEARLALPQDTGEHIGIVIVIQDQECIGWYQENTAYTRIEYPGQSMAAKIPLEPVPEQKEVKAQAAISIWDQLSSVFPVVYPFEYAVDAEYLSITPNEIRQFDETEHVLMNNSFLQHAYYNYKYLILGKKQKSEGEEEDTYYIGVPGVYHEREIMMAKMFGFEQYMCVKKEQPETGCFGYYMKQVKISPHREEIHS